MDAVRYDRGLLRISHGKRFLGNIEFQWGACFPLSFFLSILGEEEGWVWEWAEG